VASPHQSEHHWDELARALDDDRVMTFRTWCEVNDFSEATGRRLRKSGQGPAFVRLSDRRIGVTVRNNRLWQAARAKTEADNA
jgi:hypothetical protein